MWENEIEYLSRNSEDVVMEYEDKFHTIEQKIIGEWRWGNLYEIIVQSKNSDIKYIANYRLQSGDMGPAFKDCNGDELTWKEYIPEITDTDILNFVESKGSGGWIFRASTTGRGWRLYPGSSRGATFKTAREAIKSVLSLEKH